MEPKAMVEGVELLVRSPSGLSVDPDDVELVDLVDALEVGDQLAMCCASGGGRSIVVRTAANTWQLERLVPALGRWKVTVVGSQLATRAWVLDGLVGPEALRTPVPVPGASAARHVHPSHGPISPGRRLATVEAPADDGGDDSGTWAEVLVLRPDPPADIRTVDDLAQELRSSMLLLLAVLLPIVVVAMSFS